jgi:hypothetical protein
MIAVCGLAAGGCRMGLEAVDRELSACWPDCPSDGGDGGDGDGSSTDGADEMAGLQDLVLEFRTSKAVTWNWDARALGDSVNGYMIWFGTDQDEVRAGKGRVWDVDDDPNLGWRESPFGPGRVYRTTVSGLERATGYYFLLWARHQDGVSLPVAEGSATTLAARSQAVEIFTETMPPGWHSGYEDTLSDVAHEGTKSLWYKGAGEWVNATLDDMFIDLKALESVSWDDAFLELYVQMIGEDDQVRPIYYVELYLGAPGEEPFVYGAPRYATLPNRPGWHLIQVALRAFIRYSDGRYMEPGKFGTTLNRFVLSFEVPRKTTVYVDDISIRY